MILPKAENLASWENEGGSSPSATRERPSRTTLAMAAFMAVMAGCAPAAAPPTPVVLTQNEDNRLQESDIAPEPISYVVNFRPSHALGRAQVLQNAGRYDEAEHLVAATLRDNASLRGLCFERFTVGGAEIVLNVCAPSPWEERAVTQRRWLEQLGLTTGVAYVERNLTAQHSPEARPS
jgi:hypothetical protein